MTHRIGRPQAEGRVPAAGSGKPEIHSVLHQKIHLVVKIPKENPILQDQKIEETIFFRRYSIYIYP